MKYVVILYTFDSVMHLTEWNSLSVLKLWWRQDMAWKLFPISYPLWKESIDRKGTVMCNFDAFLIASLKKLFEKKKQSCFRLFQTPWRSMTRMWRDSNAFTATTILYHMGTHNTIKYNFKLHMMRQYNMREKEFLLKWTVSHKSYWQIAATSNRCKAN